MLFFLWCIIEKHASASIFDHESHLKSFGNISLIVITGTDKEKRESFPRTIKFMDGTAK